MNGSQDSPAHPSGEERASPLELFFDLVFVLSFTQVTARWPPTRPGRGLGEGMLVLAAVWWAWAAYGWLTNTIDVEENLNRLAMLAAMAAMLIVSLSLPDAFGDLGCCSAAPTSWSGSIHLCSTCTTRAGRATRTTSAPS